MSNALPEPKAAVADARRERRTSDPAAPQPHLRRILSTPQLIAFGLAYVNLIGVFIFYGLATQMTQGMMALAFLIATLAMTLTALSYAALSRKFVGAGSVYTYVSKVIHPAPAFIIGWMVLLDYLVLPLLGFVLIGLYMHQSVPIVSDWGWSMISLVVIVGLAIKGVSESAKVSMVATGVGVLFLLVFAGYLVTSIVSAGGPAAVFDLSGLFTLDALNNPDAGIPGLLAATSILCLMFLGFDGITTFAEETRDPKRQIGRAVLWTCGISGTVFVLMSYLMQLAWPNAWLEMNNPDVASTELVLRIAGPAMNVIFTVIFIVGAVASALAGLSAGARILFSMGRDRVLPSVLGRVSPRFRTPVVSICVIGAIGVLALFGDLNSVASIVNFGALIAFMSVNVCVFVQFLFRERERGTKAILRYGVLPVLGVAVNFALWISLDATAKVIGTGWFVLGVIVLAVVTRGFRKPVRTLSGF